MILKRLVSATILHGNVEQSGPTSAGTDFLVFAWPAFWWLDHYSGFSGRLRAAARAVVENDRLVVFDLRRSAAPVSAAAR